MCALQISQNNLGVCRASHVPPVPSQASSWLCGCRVFSSVGRPGPQEETGSGFGSLRVCTWKCFKGQQGGGCYYSSQSQLKGLFYL